ncbi:restriction endonuclease subunit S [Acinetobacter pittii]|uniref:restriction endonuclease subunit S n=1 Tax=Acinetobacter pittii TaxID=48296 RepID=UPI0005EBD87C|nr:restriction endonuclease subunit S [Acinetobacter pittii]RZG93034.1 restriction endonuclease subunit S [Acinetobacter pittii]RZH38826.1 restriction endonuclease subunit S [Acinetobacter pittii]
MSLDNLPVEWLLTSIENISEVIAGGTPKANDPENFVEPPNGIGWLTPADLSGYSHKYIGHGKRDLSEKGYKSSSAKLIPKGSVVFSSRAPIGYVAIASNEISTNQGFKNFVIDENISSEYLYYYLKRIRDLAESLGTGTTFKELSGSACKKLPFVLAPLAEQQEIVRQLDVMLAQVEQIKARLDASPAILKKFRQSVLADAVSGKLTEEWRGSDNYTIDESGLEIPNGWEFKQIQDIADVKGGKRLPKGEELVSDNTGYPYIRAGQLKNGTIIATEEARSSQMYLRPEVQKLIKNYVIHKYDAYITIVGASIGDAGITPEKYDGANLTENAAKLTNYKKPLLPQFLGFWLRSYYLQQLIKLETKSAAQGKLALTRIKTLPFLYPSIEEQKIIVEKVNDFLGLADGIEQTVQSAQKRVNLLTQSILAKAFSGELTAEWREQHQDLITGVNSAESLLAKIQAEREASKPAKKTRKKKEV